MQNETQVISQLFEEPSCFYGDRGSFCFKEGKLFKIPQIVKKNNLWFFEKIKFIDVFVF